MTSALSHRAHRLAEPLFPGSPTVRLRMREPRRVTRERAALEGVGPGPEWRRMRGAGSRGRGLAGTGFLSSPGGVSAGLL